MRRRIHAILLNAVTAAAGLVFVLALVEAAVRAALHSPQAARSDRPQYYYVPDTSDTLQDYPHAEPKPEDIYRVAVIGDSFTFAPGMQFDDAFPKRLERMLRTHEPGEKVEVINYGVPGYSTSHEVQVAKRAIAAGSDLIILQITLNDPQLKPLRPTGVKRGNQFSGKEFEDGIFAYWKTGAFVASRISNWESHRDYRSYYHELFSNERTWRNFRISVKRIVGETRRAGVQLVAVIFPLFGVPLDDAYPFFDIHDQIEKLLEELEVEYLDLFGAYAGIPLARLQLEPGVDFHPNEIGHRIAAESIYRWLSVEEILPPGYQLETYFAERNDIRRQEPRKLPHTGRYAKAQAAR